MGHRVHRWNLSYPVQGLIHNGAVHSFFLREAGFLSFVRDEHSRRRLGRSQAKPNQAILIEVRLYTLSLSSVRELGFGFTLFSELHPRATILHTCLISHHTDIYLLL